MPSEVWGIRGESSGGAGTGNANGSAPDYSADTSCNAAIPAVPATDGRVLWANVKLCGGAVVSKEWIRIDDATYSEGSIWRVGTFTDESGQQCVYVSTDRALYLPDKSDFPSLNVEFPSGTPICTGYSACVDCTKGCYKLTDCITGEESWVRGSGLDEFGGYLVGGRCFTIVAESDKGKCCPALVSTFNPQQAFASCASCESFLDYGQFEPCTDCAFTGIGLGGAGPNVTASGGKTSLPDCDTANMTWFWHSFTPTTTCVWRWVASGNLAGASLQVTYNSTTEVWGASYEDCEGDSSWTASSINIECTGNNDLTGAITFTLGGSPNVSVVIS